MSDIKVTDITTKKKKPIKNWLLLVSLMDQWLGETKSQEKDGAVRYNMFTHKLEVSKKLKWDEEQFDGDNEDRPFDIDSWVYHRQWNLLDTCNLRCEIDKFYPKMNFSETAVISAVEAIAKDNQYNPIKNHILKLPEWDDIPRLDRWLLDWCNASGPKPEIISLVGRKFIIGMIRRGMFPGTKVDNILILEGKQGIGKSTLVRILAGEDQLFSDDIVSDLTDSRQILEKYAGKFLVEIGELGSFSRSDQKLLKRFIVAQADCGRPAYGRYSITVDRSFSFIGTTNDGRYFEDETGLRRYWPIRVSNIDLTELRDYRNQLLAEAVVKWKENELHYFSGSYELELEREYEDFKKGKLKSGNDKLLFWIRDHWSEIINSQNEKELVSGAWLYEFVLGNYEGSFSAKQYSLIMQMLGAKSKRMTSGVWWIVPGEPLPFDPGM